MARDTATGEMTDTQVIDFLRIRFTRVDEALDEIKTNLRELTGRVGRLERSVAEAHRSIADVHVQLAERLVRMDRVADDIGRVKRRLDLVGAG